MAMDVGARVGLVAVLAALGSGVLAGPKELTAPTGVERVAWLQGCWRAASPNHTVEEQWMGPAGGSMVGMSRTVSGGELVEYELVVIRDRGERLVYVAHPSGQESAEFVSTMISDERVVFENADHDFPQRIGYERTGAELRAWVEGTRNGQVRRIDFPYRRAACP